MYSSSKSQNFIEGQVRVPHHTSICKISGRCGAMSSLPCFLFPAVSLGIRSLVFFKICQKNRRRVTLGTRGFFSRATESFVSSAAGRHVFGRRPKTTSGGAGHFLRLDRNRKPRMKSLWHPGYRRVFCGQEHC